MACFSVVLVTESSEWKSQLTLETLLPMAGLKMLAREKEVWIMSSLFFRSFFVVFKIFIDLFLERRDVTFRGSLNFH